MSETTLNVCYPERHAIEPCGDVFDYLPRISLRLDVDIKHEARLGTVATLPVRYFLDRNAGQYGKASIYPASAP
ncbi:hypothetical protein ACVXG7_09250 [Enterobacter hormaechei]